MCFATTLLLEATAVARGSDVDSALDAWRAVHGEGWQLEVDDETGFGSFLWGATVAPPGESWDCDRDEACDELAVHFAELAGRIQRKDSPE